METTNTYLERISDLNTRAQTTFEIPLPHLASGKVRELYECEAGILMVASDRLSAFDVIMEEGIPGKGIILTQMSRFWFDLVADSGLVPHHLLDHQNDRLEAIFGTSSDLSRRAMLVKSLQPLKIEAVVRGYLSGSAWKVYRETGALWDYTLPPGLRESDVLPRPLFTPSTKAESGHDLPLTQEEAADLVGEPLYDQVVDTSLALYEMGRARAEQAGIILADTKFEFGLDGDGRLHLIDEILTPDSSRYWPVDAYVPGQAQASFDKQFVRDFLETSDWDKSPPPPALPDSVISGTLDRYREAYLRIVEGSR